MGHRLTGTSTTKNRACPLPGSETRSSCALRKRFALTPCSGASGHTIRSGMLNNHVAGAFLHGGYSPRGVFLPKPQRLSRCKTRPSSGGRRRREGSVAGTKGHVAAQVGPPGLSSPGRGGRRRVEVRRASSGGLAKGQTTQLMSTSREPGRGLSIGVRGRGMGPGQHGHHEGG